MCKCLKVRAFKLTPGVDLNGNVRLFEKVTCNQQVQGYTLSDGQVWPTHEVTEIFYVMLPDVGPNVLNAFSVQDDVKVNMINFIAEWQQEMHQKYYVDMKHDYPEFVLKFAELESSKPNLMSEAHMQQHFGRYAWIMHLVSNVPLSLKSVIGSFAPIVSE